MSLLIIEHPSGYGFKSYEDEGNAVQLQESDGEKTTLYYNNMQEERNVVVCLQYVEEVANPKPIFVSVQDYYQTNLKSDTMVALTNRQVQYGRREIGTDFFCHATLRSRFLKYFRTNLRVTSVGVPALNVLLPNATLMKMLMKLMKTTTVSFCYIFFVIIWGI